MPTKQKPAGVADPTPVRAEAVASLAGEVWKPVVGMESTYEISTYGRCRRIGSNALLVPAIKRKYVRYQLCIGGKQKKMFAHRLVLAAHVGPRPVGYITRHLDGVPSNNYVGNLAWGTHKENREDMVRHDTQVRGARHKLAKLCDDDVRAIRRLADSLPQNEIAKQYGVSAATVFDVIHRKAWRHVAD